MNELVAPTYFMIWISSRRAKTLALVVLEIMIMDTAASAMMIAPAMIETTLLSSRRNSAT